jgi:preprotein translocase subunit YajC
MIKLVIALVALLAVTVGCVAAPAPGANGSSNMDWIQTAIFAVLIIGVFYFMMIRPQRKRQKDHEHLMSALQRGAKVITAGGIFGEIESLSEDSVVIKVESGATIRVARSSVLGIRQQ